MWIKSPAISCTHGFSDRNGGVSHAPFNSLNLAGSDDDAELISQNRRLALGQLGLKTDQLCILKQVHGADVRMAVPGKQEGDALVTNKKELVLAVAVADCYPVLFYDEKNKVVGAAHAGWRGTRAGIASRTVSAMEKLGAEPLNIRVAIGQGICTEHFEVGPEVITEFKSAGFPETCWKQNHIDLIACLKFDLTAHGIPEKNIWAMERCTFEDNFFSHRRDKGHTGRMWAVISLP